MQSFSPFSYPNSVHKRKYSPTGYSNYQRFKPWLRDEFTFRCVYCLERERWYPSHAAAFSVDHVIPQVIDPERICEYENMVYACLRCNSTKRDTILSDPTQVCFGDCLSVKPDGTIIGLNANSKRPNR